MKLPVRYKYLSGADKRKVREQYTLQQNGLCYHCRKPLTGEPADSVKNMHVTPALYPPTFFNWPVHLHHAHDTGLTIGVVHAYCNAVLWEYHGE